MVKKEIKMGELYEVFKFDIHNWGETLENIDIMDPNKKLIVCDYVCSDVFERMIIYSNGEVGFCCADDNGFFKLDNVIEK